MPTAAKKKPRLSHTQRAAVRVATAKHPALADLIVQERTAQRGRGNKPRWLKALFHYSAAEISAAIVYTLVEWAIVGAEDADEWPLLLTIAGALGRDLLPLAVERDQQQVGAQMLALAARAGLIEPLQDRGDGIRVELTHAARSRFTSLIREGAPHSRRRVRLTAPRGVETRKPHEMRLPRPAPPLRVEEAADKVQGTAWRVNRAVLAAVNEALDANRAGDVFVPTEAELENLAAAAELADLPQFFWPVYLDFRGRMYQRGGLFTYTSGDDYARGLLEFAHGEKLTEDGLGWLSYHMAQMWEDKPISLRKDYLLFGDGRDWVEKNPPHTLDWRQADKPVQFLAARLAWQEASSGKPCHLPVRLDASCSALQHLAMLAGDTSLARQVNLWGDTPGEKREDKFYRAVELPEHDFYQHVAAATQCERKQVKKVLVPMLYGAMLGTSADALAEHRGSSRRAKRDTALARKIRQEARKQAPKAFAVLDWLAAVAGAHNDSLAARAALRGEQPWFEVSRVPIRWSTPSGFEAVQDYRRVDKHPRRSDRQVALHVTDMEGKPLLLQLVKRFLLHDIDSGQQRLSLPSSVVHSMDAALLVETVAGANIDSWAVAHDAFGVPANHTSKLVRAYEAGLETLYRVDRLAEWAREWRDQHGVDVPDPPMTRGLLPPEMLGGMRPIG